MTKYLFYFLAIIILLLPLNVMNAGKLYTIIDESNLNHSYPAVDSYNNNNIIAWINVDEENYVKSITIENTATRIVKAEIQISTKIKFDSNPFASKHKLRISDNWLAFSCKVEGIKNNSIIVFDISKNKPELIYQLNNFNTNEFDLYGHKLVFKQEEDYYGHEISINLIDLQNNNKIKKIINCEYCNYKNISIFENKIAMTKFDWNKDELIVYDLEKEELQSESLIGNSSKNHKVRFYNEKILYTSEYQGGKIFLYNINTKENKEIYSYTSNKQIIGIDLRNNFAVFAIGDFYYPSKDGKKIWNIYLYDINNDKIYPFEEKEYIQFQPVLSKDYIIWTSGETKNLRIKYFSYSDFMNLLMIDQSIIVDSDNSMISKLKGKIVLLVEMEGQAFYINPMTKNGKYEMYYLGRPCDAFSVMREQGLGITNINLEKIPVGLNNLTGDDTDGDGLSDMFEDAIGTNKNKADTDGDGYNDKAELEGNYNSNGVEKLILNNNFGNNQKGKIFLQVENNGEAWYVNPEDGKRYFLGRPADAFQVMRNLGLGISNDDFNKLK